MPGVAAEVDLAELLAEGRAPEEPALGIIGPSPAPYLDGKLGSMYDIKPVTPPAVPRV